MRSPSVGSSGSPLSVAPSPRCAHHSSRVPKSYTNAKTTSAIVSPAATAIESAWCGIPRLAFSDPSIGSMITFTAGSP